MCKQDSRLRVLPHFSSGLKTGMEFRTIGLKTGVENNILCLKQGQDLENQAAHRHQEFPGVPPPPPGKSMEILKIRLLSCYLGDLAFKKCRLLC